MPAVQHVVVMGVSGSGKSSVASLLAEQLSWASAEADEFHPQANIDKMSAGEPLTDEDRWPWLQAMRDWIKAHDDKGESTVVTCSALKRAYRDVLREGGQVEFAHLSGEAEVISGRMSGRAGHFMPPSLLPSQFQTLEQLEDDEAGVTVSIEGTLDEITATIIKSLGLTETAADARES